MALTSPIAGYLTARRDANVNARTLESVSCCKPFADASQHACFDARSEVRNLLLVPHTLKASSIAHRLYSVISLGFVPCALVGADEECARVLSAADCPNAAQYSGTVCRFGLLIQYIISSPLIGACHYSTGGHLPSAPNSLYSSRESLAGSRYGFAFGRRSAGGWITLPVQEQAQQR